MENSKYFKGSIVIGDPSYFVNNEEDWQKCEYGEAMDKLGFTDFMFIEFPDDPPKVRNKKTGEIYGGICQDSGVVVVVYKHELEKYNPDYEKGFFSKDNRAIIEDFEGVVSVTEESIGEYTDTVIKGTGNLEFESFYEED